MSELSLGQALAILDAHDHNLGNGNAAGRLFAPAEDVFLNSLRERRKILHTKPHLVQEVFNAIPEHGCEEEYSFLADTIDVFLVYLKNSPHAAKESTGECSRLFKHINNCFLCFEEYSLVHRDYWHKLQELRGKGETNTDN
ncbi:MAG: hypothetical protein AAB354_13030 [candidate division KSB1 bacterium]